MRRVTGQRRQRRGAVLVYSVVAMLGLTAVCSLAVDYARVQAVKTDLQRCADATARGHLALYKSSNNNATFAQYWGQFLPTSTVNPVDSGSGIQPTVSIQWGTWNSTTKTFTAGSYTSSNASVQVTVSRRAANNNGVQLMWASILGRRTCDVSATAVASLSGTSSANVTVPSQSDPWLAGMANGSTASYADTAPGQSPYRVTSIPVVPGSYITFTNVAGAVRHGPTLSDDDAEGGAMYSHGIDSPGGPTPAAENGIADVVMPINAFLGVFLTDAAPNTTAAPSRLDYSTAASRDETVYDDIQNKQPFFIGDGQTSGGTVQQFRVPPGATRLYLGVMDGYEWANNQGSFTATLTVYQTVAIVK